ncbi:MAG: hypothetical protein ACRERU_14485 [Methylococcales bacterium]
MSSVTPFFHEPTSSLSYLVRDPGGKSCAVIDPVMDYDPAVSTLSTAFADRIVEAVTSTGLEEDFVEFRTQRDTELAPPSLLFPSVQLNIRAGRMPPPASKGRCYLKIPIRI